MNAKELLIPRFEVIADYPNSTYKVGEIFHAVVPDYAKYPHLFKPLNWWEYRKEEEMPKKVKSLTFINDEPLNIEKWDMFTFFGYTNFEEKRGCELTAWRLGYGYVPVD